MSVNRVRGNPPALKFVNDGTCSSCCAKTKQLKRVILFYFFSAENHSPPWKTSWWRPWLMSMKVETQMLYYEVLYNFRVRSHMVSQRSRTHTAWPTLADVQHDVPGRVGATGELPNREQSAASSYQRHSGWRHPTGHSLRLFDHLHVYYDHAASFGEHELCLRGFVSLSASDVCDWSKRGNTCGEL